MGNAFKELWSIAASVLGLAVFIAMMWAVARAHAVMWRRVSARYSRGRRFPASPAKLETIVIAQHGALQPFNPQARQYAGTLLSVSDNGLCLKLIPIPPLNVLAPPLYLPFDEMTVARTTWALWPEPFAVRMSGLPEIDIILARESVAWIRGRTARRPFGRDV